MVKVSSGGPHKAVARWSPDGGVLAVVVGQPWDASVISSRQASALRLVQPALAPLAASEPAVLLFSASGERQAVSTLMLAFVA